MAPIPNYFQAISNHGATPASRSTGPEAMYRRTTGSASRTPVGVIVLLTCLLVVALLAATWCLCRCKHSSASRRPRPSPRRKPTRHISTTSSPSIPSRVVTRESSLHRTPARAISKPRLPGSDIFSTPGRVLGTGATVSGKGVRLPYQDGLYGLQGNPGLDGPLGPEGTPGAPGPLPETHEIQHNQQFVRPTDVQRQPTTQDERTFYFSRGRVLGTGEYEPSGYDSAAHMDQPDNTQSAELGSGVNVETSHRTSSRDTGAM
ncbi:hypothetical protein PG984_002734 [Apiospora sp. TS-2023a]